MKFQEIRSATAIITFGGVRFLLDPWLGEKGSIPPIPGSPNPDLRCPVSDLPLPINEILKVDAVIATHLHFDHFDDKAMERIPRSMPIFVQDALDAETLRGKGFADLRILKYGGLEFRGVMLYKTDCLHGQFENIGLLYEKMNLRSEACGVVMRHPEEKTLYLVGDTIWCGYVKGALETWKPDVVVVNAAEATICSFGRIIMGLEDLQEVLDHAPQAVVIASHMDNVGHEKLWRKDLRRYRSEHHLEGRLLIPEDGEVCEFEKKGVSHACA